MGLKFSNFVFSIVILVALLDSTLHFGLFFTFSDKILFFPLEKHDCTFCTKN